MSGKTSGTPVRRVWERDKGICWICHLPCALEHATRDHVRPRSKMAKGQAIHYNLKLAHQWCNWERGNHHTSSAPEHPNTDARHHVERALLAFHDLTWFDPIDAFRARQEILDAHREERSDLAAEPPG